MKEKLNRKKSDIQEVIDHVTFVIIWGQVQSEWLWLIAYEWKWTVYVVKLEVYVVKRPLSPQINTRCV